MLAEVVAGFTAAEGSSESCEPVDVSMSVASEEEFFFVASALVGGSELHGRVGQDEIHLDSG